jgi:hypothetical protein
MKHDSRANTLKSIFVLRRTISAKNLSERSGVALTELYGIMQSFEKAGIVRIAARKACSATCTSCDTCGMAPVQGFTGEEIVISLIVDGTDAS